MNAPRWRIPVLALFQLILILPPMMTGSICMPIDGAEGLELGFCACTRVSLGPVEATIQPTDQAACGPCRDEAFSPLRGRPHVPSAPAQAFPSVLPCAVAMAHSVGGTDPWSGEPPGRLLPILRC
jgi:hypothetical protein